jgi:hypothetical protein
MVDDQWGGLGAFATQYFGIITIHELGTQFFTRQWITHRAPKHSTHSMFFFERDLDPDLAGSMLFWGMAGLIAKINLLVKTCLNSFAVNFCHITSENKQNLEFKMFKQRTWNSEQEKPGDVPSPRYGVELFRFDCQESAPSNSVLDRKCKDHGRTKGTLHSGRCWAKHVGSFQLQGTFWFTWVC